VFDVRAPSPPQKSPVDVRETPEYKKALELQLWMEEQQALYKAQVCTSVITKTFNLKRVMKAIRQLLNGKNHFSFLIDDFGKSPLYMQVRDSSMPIAASLCSCRLSCHLQAKYCCCPLSDSSACPRHTFVYEPPSISIHCSLQQWQKSVAVDEIQFRSIGRAMKKGFPVEHHLGYLQVNQRFICPSLVIQKVIQSFISAAREPTERT
jgi:hypothetical protein